MCAKLQAAAFVLLLCVIVIPEAHAANIVTFDDNANKCGGAVICSFNGTLGYLNNGTGAAFDLSTISQWFQIDTTGTNQLATQTQPEPNGGAGAFLVLNDTGSTVTSFSLTLNDTFTKSTPSVTFCSGSSGPLCDNFQANKGSGAPGTASEALSGPDFSSCTNGTPMGGFPCASTGGQAAANFTPGSVTFDWSGLNIGAGKTFDISFASWNNTTFTTPSPVPEPGTLTMFGTGLLVIAGLGRRLLLKGSLR